MCMSVHTRWFNGHPSRRTWISQFSLDSHLIFNTIPQCPSQTENGWQWRKRSRGRVHSMRCNYCRDFVAKCPSCRQPVIKTSTGPRPIFIHQQTPEGRDVAPFYVCSVWVGVTVLQQNADSLRWNKIIPWVNVKVHKTHRVDSWQQEMIKTWKQMIFLPVRDNLFEMIG